MPLCFCARELGIRMKIAAINGALMISKLISAYLAGGGLAGNGMIFAVTPWQLACGAIAFTSRGNIYTHLTGR